eukprot:CAMPEP_0198493888 /NCGR_PEP_ID=MMETSP1462-20131121/4284_1 /TAXON_ID=1333877 /ORGANISM="Brandtodinium nutriculum, Strain RCC3387" /LENGTH=237 /DNA_ID=CAMNT_0044222601 /DNA_START=386 /DNA_END=1098 /DNA_ORIENTATION=+
MIAPAALTCKSRSAAAARALLPLRHIRAHLRRGGPPDRAGEPRGHGELHVGVVVPAIPQLQRRAVRGLAAAHVPALARVRGEAHLAEVGGRQPEAQAVRHERALGRAGLQHELGADGGVQGVAVKREAHAPAAVAGPSDLALSAGAGTTQSMSGCSTATARRRTSTSRMASAATACCATRLLTSSPAAAEAHMSKTQSAMKAARSSSVPLATRARSSSCPQEAAAAAFCSSEQPAGG